MVNNVFTLKFNINLNTYYLPNHKKALFANLLTQGKYYQHCSEVENQTRDKLDAYIEKMGEAEVVTEQLKDENRIEWCRERETVIKACGI